MCQACDTFDSTVTIHGPQQLRGLVQKVRDAISAGILSCNEFESSRALIGQGPFAELTLDTTIPDVMRYYFVCESCDAVFGLFVEAFHGSGGEWSKL